MALLPVVILLPMVMAAICVLAGRVGNALRDALVSLTGAVIFTICTFVFTSVQDRLSSGPAARLAPIMSALGIWLAVQAFAGIGL